MFIRAQSVRGSDDPSTQSAILLPGWRPTSMRAPDCRIAATIAFPGG